MGAIVRVIDVGLGLSIQDGGRKSWLRYGVPPSGFIDAHSAHCANKLVENRPEAPLLEMLVQGQKFEFLEPCWVACCGADANPNIPMDRAVPLRSGDIISFPRNSSGIWIYLAFAGGLDVRKVFGSCSYYARAKLGQSISKGDVLSTGSSNFALQRGVSGRTLHWQDKHDFSNPPLIRLWPGPQFNAFSAVERQLFCEEAWSVSPQSDRVGYRLSGPRLHPSPSEIISEPVPVGSIQVPENGQPLITMPDGPTVGGYPKIAVVHPSDLGWVAQRRPGQTLRFTFINEARP